MKLKAFFSPVGNKTADEVRNYVETHKEGSFTLLDVRQPKEYEKYRLPGAKLIPLPELTDRIEELDPDKPLIAYWAVGGRSRAAVQLLAGEGFKEVYNMKGGIKAWDGLTAAGPADMGMSLISGEASLKEIIAVAYGMEKGLGELYRRLSEMTDDSEAGETFNRLAGYEDKHKERLFALYRSLEPGVEETDLARMAQDHDIIEGGFAPDAFVEQHQDEMQTVPDILNMAMMLEAQAMDLYHRYSQKVDADDAKHILYDIAEEEKDHLNRLGRLMEERS